MSITPVNVNETSKKHEFPQICEPVFHNSDGSLKEITEYVKGELSAGVLKNFHSDGELKECNLYLNDKKV